MVFDLDGTLLDTGVIDTDRCFAPVFQAFFGMDRPSEDWSTYAEPTSAGIFDEITRRVRGRPPTLDEAIRVQDLLEVEMRKSFIQGADRIVLMKGTLPLLARLRADPGWRLAVATGNWLREAAVKLESAGLDLSALPIATSDDRIARREILPLAVARASEVYGVQEWRRVVYVGDGAWDVRACRHNGIPFVGVGTGERAETLRTEGAVQVIADFLNVESVVRSLEAAVIP